MSSTEYTVQYVYGTVILQSMAAVVIARLISVIDCPYLEFFLPAQNIAHAALLVVIMLGTNK